MEMRTSGNIFHPPCRLQRPEKSTVVREGRQTRLSLSAKECMYWRWGISLFHSSKTLNSSVLDLSKKVEKTMKLNEFDKRGVFSFPEQQTISELKDWTENRTKSSDWEVSINLFEIGFVSILSRSMIAKKYFDIYLIKLLCTLIDIADSAQTEYCPTFHCSSVCPCVRHRRDISHFSHI